MNKINQKKVEMRTKIDNKTSCWIWQGYCTKKGQPQISTSRMAMSAMRFSFMAFVGPIFDRSIAVRQSCENSKCVNPDHLVLVKLGQKVNEPKCCPNGHERNAKNIYISKKGKKLCHPCMIEKSLRDRDRKNPNRRVLKDMVLTHCKHGHEFNDLNTHINKSGSKICRECMRIYAERKRNEKNPDRKRRAPKPRKTRKPKK